MAKFIPERGDVVWLNLDPQAGHEQKGRRPALTISPKEYNSKTGLAIFVPITTQSKGYPFEVQIPEGIKISGVILSDHIKSLDWKIKDAKFICILPPGTLNEVIDKIQVIIT